MRKNLPILSLLLSLFWFKLYLRITMLEFFENDYQLDFSDVLLVPNIHPNDELKSRMDVDLIHPDYNAVPIIVANMDSIGTFEMASHLKEFRLMVALLKDFTARDWEENIAKYNLDPSLLIPTVGTKDIEKEARKLEEITNMFGNIPFVCLDVANGYLPGAAKAVKELKQAMPQIKVCAGNVVDGKGLEHLALAGADIVKVGIGSGGVCLTRMKTGVGFPQFSAIQEVFDYAKANNVQIISDGGITCAGDTAKAFAAGADMVMMGSYFAGHEETGTDFHGMSSDRSRVARGEKILDYRASEGREVKLENKGPIVNTLRDLTGGIRSACTYLGLSSLHEAKNAKIRAIKVHSQLNRIKGVSDES